MQVVDFLQSIADDNGKLTGVTNLIGSMAIKPAHTTSDEEVNVNTSCSCIASSHSHITTVFSSLTVACDQQLYLLSGAGCKFEFGLN